MKLKIARQVRYYLPRGIQSKLNDQALIGVGVIVTHGRGRKITNEHLVHETCADCEQLSVRKSAVFRSFASDSR
jgi:hypothetical protein